MNLFKHPVRPEDVGELMDLSVENDPDSKSMAKLQLEGIAALHNILCKQNFAYLADEVGMGKTYQALGLAALVWNEQPDARILFVSPRQNLQVKWQNDYVRFFSSNYRREQSLGDDRAVSVLLRQPIHRPEVFHNLRSWIPTIGMPERIAPFVRHTSFTRPVFLRPEDSSDLARLSQNVRSKIRGWGLFEFDEPSELNDKTASLELNLAFARSLNARLRNESEGKGSFFDLVIVDEAQCLRNPTNQTNRVLHTVFESNVEKWLFMSATPAHSGPEDLPTILNHYPGEGEVLDPMLAKAEDLGPMQTELQRFLVRRQRKYLTRPKSTQVGKDRYRNHDKKGWAISDHDMSVLDTLSIGLVQKGLVNVLQGRNNRYRIGFLSSFESLQTSLSKSLPLSASDIDGQDESNEGDWHKEKHNPQEEQEAPDTQFIARLQSDFEEEFGIPMRHPKVDYVADKIAALAFGTDSQAGGHKFLVFTRRLSTVEALRNRLSNSYHMSIERRIRRCWGKNIDWSGEGLDIEEPDDLQDPEHNEHETLDSRFRQAMSERGWLFRYRQTFRGSGRNTLFFEDGWLRRLCEAGGVSPEDAARRLPSELWARSWSHASRSSTSGGHYRARRIRYLALDAIRHHPECFGLDFESATPWRTAYESMLHDEYTESYSTQSGGDPHFAEELFTQPTLWTEWDKRFKTGPLALPVCQVRDHSASELEDELCRRQVIRVLLGQVFRLTDTLIDLYYADEQVNRDTNNLPSAFLNWLESDDPSASQMRNECEAWICHLRLILDSCLDSAGKSWRELARKETWTQLNELDAVRGVVGGSGAHRTAIRQFRTPSLPRVIVCTDTLKEGVDLHLFCDRVVHYGVAWTSGDLEQRVGRVDRYFSQIERRLRDEGCPPDVALQVSYPHVVASLERGQVDRVIDRQRRVEELLNSPLANAQQESKDMVPGSVTTRENGQKLETYGGIEAHFPAKRRNLSILSKHDAKATKGHYRQWYDQLLNASQEEDWKIVGSHSLREQVQLQNTNSTYGLGWKFDSSLRRYILTVSFLSENDLAEGLYGKRIQTGSRERNEPQSFIRLLVPVPQEDSANHSISSLLSLLKQRYPLPSQEAAKRWGNRLESLAKSDFEWISEDTTRAVVGVRGVRQQSITLSVYDGGIQVTSLVASLNELEQRTDWGGAPKPHPVRDWALQSTNNLTLGYLQLDQNNDLVFGTHVLHGELPENSGKQLLAEIANRADAWEAALTGLDRR